MTEIPSLGSAGSQDVISDLLCGRFNDVAGNQDRVRPIAEWYMHRPELRPEDAVVGILTQAAVEYGSVSHIQRRLKRFQLSSNQSEKGEPVETRISANVMMPPARQAAENEQYRQMLHSRDRIIELKVKNEQHLRRKIEDVERRLLKERAARYSESEKAEWLRLTRQVLGRRELIGGFRNLFERFWRGSRDRRVPALEMPGQGVVLLSAHLNKSDCFQIKVDFSWPSKEVGVKEEKCSFTETSPPTLFSAQAMSVVLVGPGVLRLYVMDQFVDFPASTEAMGLKITADGSGAYEVVSGDRQPLMLSAAPMAVPQVFRVGAGYKRRIWGGEVRAFEVIAMNEDQEKEVLIRAKNSLLSHGYSR